MALALGYLAFLPSTGEWLVLLVIGLLLFGKRLPQVLKDAGRTIAEFKRGLQKFKDQLDHDKDFRELTSAAADLKQAVRTPQRILQDAVYDATHQVEQTLAHETRDVFEGLTDESRVSPGPDATIVSPPAPSLFEMPPEAGAAPQRS